MYTAVLCIVYLLYLQTTITKNNLIILSLIYAFNAIIYYSDNKINKKNRKYTNEVYFRFIYKKKKLCQKIKKLNSFSSITNTPPSQYP